MYCTDNARGSVRQVLKHLIPPWQAPKTKAAEQGATSDIRCGRLTAIAIVPSLPRSLFVCN